MSSLGKIVQLLNPSNAQDAATKSYVDTKFTTVPTPTNTNDAANKGYVDTKTTDMATNASVTTATSGMATTTAVNTAITTALGSDGTQENRPTSITTIPSGGSYIVGVNGTSFQNGKIRRELITGTNLPYFYDDRFVIQNRLGIGTATPSCSLHVSGSSSLNMNVGTRVYYAKTGGSGTYSPDSQTFPISIISEQHIWIKGDILWITSDQRIKSNIVNLNADKMINVFRNLRPISFDFIDPMKNSNKKHFGFIAQEVNEVLPEGISLNTDVIPNNMIKADIAKPSETYETQCFTLKPDDTDIALQYLLLTTDTPLIFDISNSYTSTNIYKFKIYGGKEWAKEQDIYIRSEYNVTDDKYTYVIGMKKEAYDNVLTESTLFVYGQYVYDLHILDHDTIYTVATAALQEVDRQQQADKARIAELENHVSNLEATVSAQQSLINDILERLKKVERA